MNLLVVQTTKPQLPESGTLQELGTKMAGFVKSISPLLFMTLEESHARNFT
jgi:hypothetical protein